MSQLAAHAQAMNTARFSLVETRPLYPKETIRRAVNLASRRSFPRGAVLSHLGAAANHVYTISDAGTVSGGTWTYTAQHPISGLSFTTAPLAHNISNADLQTALVAFYGSGNVAVAGSGLPAADTTITLQGELAGLPAPDASIDDSELTGSGAELAIESTTISRTADTYDYYPDAKGSGGTADAVLPTPVDVDGSGRIYHKGQMGLGQGGLLVWEAYFKGVFRTQDLTGLDSDGIADLGRLLKGDLTNGIINIR